MLVILIIILIIFIVLAIVINSALGNLRHRAGQAILKDTPFSDSAINKMTSNVLGGRAKKKFLEDYQGIYSEESIIQYLCDVGEHIIKRQPMEEFSDNVIEKINKDSKIDKLVAAKITRANIMSYARNTLAIIVVADNGRDEYSIVMNATTGSNGIEKIIRYNIQRGAAVGF